MEALSFKIVVVGNSGTGKTCWSKRIFGEPFTYLHQPTASIDMRADKFRTNHGLITISIWEISGGGNYKGLTEAYTHNADAIIIFCDTTSADSIKSIPTYAAKYPNTHLVIALNKYDLTQLSDYFIEGLRQLATVVPCSAKKPMGCLRVLDACIPHIDVFERHFPLPEEELLDDMLDKYYIDDIDGEEVCLPKYD